MMWMVVLHLLMVMLSWTDNLGRLSCGINYHRTICGIRNLDRRAGLSWNHHIPGGSMRLVVMVRGDQIPIDRVDYLPMVMSAMMTRVLNQHVALVVAVSPGSVAD